MQAQQKLLLSQSVTLTAILLLGLSASCKKSDSSDLMATTTLGGKAIDLTTFTAATPTNYAGFKKETKPDKYTAAVNDIKKKAIKPKGKMTQDELIAVNYYTGADYVTINGKLRGTDADSLNSIQNLVKTTASGVNKVPATSCIAYRGVKSNAALDKIYTTAKKVGRIEDGAFFSTSATKSVALNFLAGAKGYLLTIKSSRCHNIKFASQFPNENEVLFAPGSEFIVNPKTTTVGKYEVINMTHVTTKTGFKKILSGAKQNIVLIITGKYGNFPAHKKGNGAALVESTGFALNDEQLLDAEISPELKSDKDAMALLEDKSLEDAKNFLETEETR
jgi:hypothetical protein